MPAAWTSSFQRCPLKDAWRDAGLSDADIARLCQIAGRMHSTAVVGALDMSDRGRRATGCIGGSTVLSASIRQPSILSSYTQGSRWNGCLTCVACIALYRGTTAN
jgi:hypothetical protein